MQEAVDNSLPLLIMTQIPNFISHYYERDIGAFKSMTDNGHKKAKEIFSALKQTGKSAKSKFPDSYIDLRKEVETWLQAEFIKRGGQPKRQNPIYTILGTCDWLLDWYENGAKETLLLSTLEGKQVSFTYPDSMISYQLFSQKEDIGIKYDMKEHYGRVYLLDELHDTISKYGLPKGELRNGRPDFDMYIEMQIWEDIKS